MPLFWACEPGTNICPLAVVVAGLCALKLLLTCVRLLYYVGRGLRGAYGFERVAPGGRLLWWLFVAFGPKVHGRQFDLILQLDGAWLGRVTRRFDTHMLAMYLRVNP